MGRRPGDTLPSTTGRGSAERLLISVAMCVAAWAVFVPQAGLAAVVCSVSDQTLTVTSDADDAITVSRGDDAILVNDVPCGGATVASVSSIAIREVPGTNGAQDVTIDLSGGPFEPGLGAEPGVAEIEFAIELGGGENDQLAVSGRGVADTLVWGALGIALNADGDVDVTVASPELLAGRALGGAGANDTVGGHGGFGTGGAATFRLRLSGSSGNDLLVGGDGPDLLRGNAGNDTIRGGNGIDEVSYSGSDGLVTIDLTAGTATGEGDDTIEAVENVTGSDFSDVIVGDAAPNLLRGRGGDDDLQGSTGDDELRGEEGADVLDGGPGDDLVRGGPGADSLAGGAGRDFLRGEEGDDGILGGGGDDRLQGDAGADRLDGGDGSDRLEGGAAEDVLLGGRGHDRLEGGAGGDRLSGGQGNDRFFARDRVRDTVNGGPGVDRATVDGIDRLRAIERLA